jgi:HSP20 family protein
MTKQKRSFFEKLTGAREVDAPTESYQENVNVYSPVEESQTLRMTTGTNEYAAPAREEGSWAAPSYTPQATAASSDDADGQLTIDVYQTENDIVIKSTIAGVKPEDLDVSINNDMVSIRGERKNEEVVEHGNYYYQECYWGSFSRSVLLPVDVIPEKADAALKNGILTIRLPKADTTKTKKIQVRGF